ncbi:MAG: hypothetical protein U0531_00555 [Dehalococcoidia bacterium]
MTVTRCSACGSSPRRGIRPHVVVFDPIVGGLFVGDAAINGALDLRAASNGPLINSIDQVGLLVMPGPSSPPISGDGPRQHRYHCGCRWTQLERSRGSATVNRSIAAPGRGLRRPGGELV